jgi:hypothetical protein
MPLENLRYGQVVRLSGIRYGDLEPRSGRRWEWPSYCQKEATSLAFPFQWKSIFMGKYTEQIYQAG